MTDDNPASSIVRVLRASLLTLGLLTTAFSIATARAVLEGEAYLDRADGAIRRKDFSSAIAESRSAALWYVPGAPHVSGAYRRLEHVARVSEAQNDPATALEAWRSVRASAVETRWLIQPHRDEIVAADQAIARLTAPPPPKDGSSPPPAPPSARNGPQEESRSMWLIALALGLITTISGTFVAAVRVDRAPSDKRFEIVQVPLLVAAAGLAMYLLAVWRA